MLLYLTLIYGHYNSQIRQWWFSFKRRFVCLKFVCSKAQSLYIKHPSNKHKLQLHFFPLVYANVITLKSVSEYKQFLKDKKEIVYSKQIYLCLLVSVSVIEYKTDADIKISIIISKHLN